MTRTLYAVVASTACALALFVTTGTASAASCENLTVGALTTVVSPDNFQAGDGDQCSPGDSVPAFGGLNDIDWHNLATPTPDDFTGDTFRDNDTSDAGLGSLNTDQTVFGCNTTAPKEENPTGWCYSPNSIQDKSNVITAWLSKALYDPANAGDPPDLFVRFAFARIGTQGSVNLDVEFNRRADLYHVSPNPAGYPNGFDVPRRTGNGDPLKSDLLLSFDWNGGAAQITRCFWKGDDLAQPWVSGTWVSATKVGGNFVPCDNSAGSPDILDTSTAIAAVNDWDSHAAEPITNYLPGGDFNTSAGVRTGQLLDGQFGEADINLTKALGLNTLHPCTSFGSIFMHSRSSTTITSDPKDWVTPQSIPLQDCGTIKIAKVTDPANASQTDRFNYSQSGSDALSLQNDPAKDINDGTDNGWTGASPNTDNTSFQLADGTDRTITNVLPGTYNISEDLADAAGKGYALTDLKCTESGGTNNNTTTVTKASGLSTLKVDPGETVSCTYTNTKQGSVAIKKVTDPHNANDTFSFTHHTSGTSNITGLHDGQTSTAQSVAPGTYVFTEDASSHYDLTSITCNDGGSTVPSTVDKTARQVTFNVEAGENVVCTYTNTKHGSIAVKKLTIPSGQTDGFNFTGGGGANNVTGLKDGQTSTPQEVSAGAYSFTEAAAAGYDLTSVTCSDGNSTGDVPTRKATLNVEPGENVVCTFTNTKRGTVAVKKITEPHTTDTFSFTAGGGPNNVTGLGDGQTSTPQSVAPGTYTFTEDAASHYDLKSITCNDGNSTGDVSLRKATLNVAAGENVVCTFTNTKHGSVAIKKLTLPSGQTDTFSFTHHTAGTTNVTGLTDGQTSTPQEVSAGSYVFTEDASSHYDLTSITCNDGNSTVDKTARQATFNVEPGENVVCTYTNTKHGSVAIKKLTVPSGVADTFSFTHHDAGTSDVNGLGDGQTSAAQEVSPGNYSFTENAAAGYDLTGISCNDGNSTTDRNARQATFHVDPGENVVCTYTNSRIPTLKVIKKVVNDSGGTAVPADFSMHVATGGADVPNSPQPGSTAGTTYTGADGTTYVVSEDQHAGYAGTTSGDCASDGSITLHYGDTATCTITNDDISPRLTVIKHVDNQGTSGGGAKSAGDFTMNVTATNPSSASFPGDENGTKVTVDAGTYSVEEGAHDGYRESKSSGCSGTLALDQEATCTITNTRILPSVLVVKVRDQDHAYDGDTLTYKYDVTNNGNSPLTSVSLTDTVNGHAGCTDIKGPTGDNGDGILSPGETWHYTCSTGFSHGDEKSIDGLPQIENVVTVTSKDEEGKTVNGGPAHADVPVFHPAISIVKGGPPSADPGDVITYFMNVTNTGDEAFAESTVVVTDPKCDASPVLLVGKNNDPTGGTLDPGDVWTYTCSLQSQTGQPLVHNDAFVVAADQFGKVVDATAGVDTLLVLGEKFGNARASAPSGCQSRAFNARVLGTNIAKVVFYLDGKKLKTITKPKKVGLSQVFQMRFNPAKMRIGVHRIVMKATFAADTSNDPKTVTFKRSFQRCGKRLVAPQFTG